MALAVTQETFNDTVLENIEEFGMTPEEALEDTVKQLEAQGIDLSNIIQELALSCTMDFTELTQAVKNLSDSVKNRTASKDEIRRFVNIIRQNCDKNLQHRVAAGKEGAYGALVDTILSYKSDHELVTNCLTALTALMTKQPDLLDDTGVGIIIDIVTGQKDEAETRQCLRWAKECCVLHEHNRQKIFDSSILDRLKPILTKKDLTSGLLLDVLSVLRALVLDDDIRVEFGRAHEHARVIASDTLCSITGLLTKFKDNESVTNDIMLTLSALVVRAEFCKKVVDAGALIIINDALVTFRHNEKIVRQCLKLLKALAGNDECKALIVSGGATPHIVAAFDKHVSNAQTAIFGLGCVAALVLRSPENSKVLFEAGVARVLVEAMRLHADNEAVQKNASWAIRNMVSRSKNQCKTFLNLGAEDLLKDALKKFTASEYDIKSALRDLGCKVDLKEEWTGKGGKLNTQAKKK